MDSVTPDASPVRGLPIACGAVTAAVAFVVLVEWVVGVEPSTTLSFGRVPMTPSTAVALILLGVALYLIARWPGRPSAVGVARCVGVLVAGLGLMGIARLVFGIDPVLDRLAPHSATAASGIRVGMTSPLTACCCVLAGLALLLPARRATPNVAAMAAIAILLIAGVIALGYCHGTPLMYGTSARPMALATALVFMVWGLGATLAGRPQVWPVSSLVGSSARARLLRAFLPFSVAAIALVDAIEALAERLTGLNPGLLAATADAVCLLAAGAFASRLAVSIGAAIDRAEAERDEAEKARGRTETRYRELVEAANSIILRIDPDFNITFANEFAQSFFGYSVDELVGHSVLATIVPETESTGRDLRAMLADIKANPAAHQDSVNENVTKSGQRVWIAWTHQFNYDEAGNYTGLLTVGNDITALKRAEERVSRLNSLLRAISDVNQLVVRVHERGPLLQGICDLLAAAEGHASAWVAVLGDEGRFEAIHMSAAGPRGPALRSMLERGDLPRCVIGTLEGFEVNPCIPDSDTCRDCPLAYCGPCPARMSIRLECQGEVYGLLVVCADVSLVTDEEEQMLLSEVAGDLAYALRALEVAEAHRESETAVRESEERYRALFERSPIATVIVRDALVLHRNQACARLFGADEASGMLGSPLADWVAPAHRQLVAERIRSREAGVDVPATYESAGMRADGTEVPLYVQAGHIALPDGPALLTFMMDLTERKQAENAERLAAVGQLAAGVAHEFNNVLAAMSGRAQLAQAIGDHLSVEKLIETVLKGTERGAEICHNILAFARPQEPKRQAIYVEEPLEAALSLAARELENAEIRVIREGTGELHRIYADAGQLQQVFLNLIINACHATPGGGTLTVSAERAPGQTDAGDVVITIADTGAGIPPEHLPHIFEPFFTTKGRLGESERAGTGLGLSVSHGIIAAHGGNITATSQLGHGTTFTVRLAAYDGSEPLPEAGVSEELALDAGDAARGAILLAEDETDVRETMAAALGARGFMVTCAVTTDEALELLAAQTVDVIITDLMMPGGGGRRMLSAVSALSDPPPVIVVTGRLEQQVTDELRAAGAVDCLHKPFSLEELLRAVDRVLDGSRRTS